VEGSLLADLHVVSVSPPHKRHPQPILFVHGAFHGAWVWEEQFLPYFADHGYEVHALDWRGHGRSPGYEHLAQNRLSDYIEDVMQVATSLPTVPILVGHSMGGFVVQKCLERLRAPAAVLLASAPPGGTRSTTLQTALRHPGQLLKSLVTGRVDLYNSEEWAVKAFFSPTIDQARLVRYVARLQEESLRAFLEMARLPVQTERVQSPVLVLGAGNDFFIDAHELAATAKAYGTEPEVFPGMAHDLMLEEGWQQVADRIMSWLTEKGL
jgi:pimeloyl-ACP methyl ester carboxylesterase